MAWQANLTSVGEGSYRSLKGAADEDIFMGRALRAGFLCYSKEWRDAPYDATIGYKTNVYRVEVKGGSSGTFSFTHGDRSGIQINHSIDKSHALTRTDCDFVCAMDSNDGTCYIIPIDIVEIYGRIVWRTGSLRPFRERWQLMVYGEDRLTADQTKNGLRNLSIDVLTDIAQRLGVQPDPQGIQPEGTRGLRITNPHDVLVASIWLHLAATLMPGQDINEN